MKRVVNINGAYTAPNSKNKQSYSLKRETWLSKQELICDYCGIACHRGDGPKETLATCDHIIPRSRGGLDLESNWALACCACNLKKGHEIWVTDKLEHNEVDLTGTQVGLLTVLGKHIKRASDGARWVVQCVCRNLEVRSSKSIKSPTDPVDCCLPCKKKYRGPTLERRGD